MLLSLLLLLCFATRPNSNDAPSLAARELIEFQRTRRCACPMSATDGGSTQMASRPAARATTCLRCLPSARLSPSSLELKFDKETANPSSQNGFRPAREQSGDAWWWFRRPAGWLASSFAGKCVAALKVTLANNIRERKKPDDGRKILASGNFGRQRRRSDDDEHNGIVCHVNFPKAELDLGVSKRAAAAEVNKRKVICLPSLILRGPPPIYHTFRRGLRGARRQETLTNRLGRRRGRLLVASHEKPVRRRRLGNSLREKSFVVRRQK